MKTPTKYLYSFSNASLTLEVIDRLRNKYQSGLNSVAVINLIDCWLIKINFDDWVDAHYLENLQAVLDELGIPYQPSAVVRIALAKLESGESPIEIMNRYKVVIVAYGEPEKEEIEVFREQIVEKLGYCPQNMA